MTYRVPKSFIDFRFGGSPYLIGNDAAVDFTGKPSVVYVPPPELTASTHSQWQTGQVSQDQYTGSYQNSRVVEVFRNRPASSQSTFSSYSHQDDVIRLPWGFGSNARDGDYASPYGGTTDPETNKKPEPEQPDIGETYLLMNTITTVVLPDRTPIEMPSLEISLDIDSFSWSFTGELWGAASLAMVEPDQDGPKQIEVNINGWKRVFIIERLAMGYNHHG